MGQLCEDLNEVVGQGIYYDTFAVRNTKWLWLVSNIVTAINNDETIRGCFGRYASFVAGILNSVKRINFYVLCGEQLNYENYIEKCIGDEECSVSYKSHTGNYFRLSFQGVTICICFEERLFPKLPSELIFAQSVLKKIRLSCLTNGIVMVKGRVTFVTNEVKSSMHDCAYDVYFCGYDSPTVLADCKVYSQYCSLHPNNTCPHHKLYSSRKSFRVSAYTKCHCELCVKGKPASLKSLCVNKLITRIYLLPVKTKKTY
jgi:hypothetical protein